MDNRAIGIFDSGLGGLTAVKALRELLPDENIIYFADSARVPYGSREPAQLRKMALQDMDFLSGFDVKLILAACGTISCNLPETLAAYPRPARGVMLPAVKAMAALEGDYPLGIIATQASIKCGVYRREIEKRCPGRKIFCQACPDFVTLIESGHSEPDDPLVIAAVEKYLSPLKEAGVGAILLGCTHFGIIASAIARYMGSGVRLVSAAGEAAREIRDYLLEAGLSGGEGSALYYTSGSGEEFSSLASTFLGRELESRPVHVDRMEE